MLTARWAASWLAANAVKRLTAQQRRVTGDHHDRAGGGSGCLHGHPNRMSGAVLGLLHHQQGVGHQFLDVGPDLFALATDHRHDSFRFHRSDGGQHMADHAPAGHGVQYLHRLRPHPGTAARGQDDDGQLVPYRVAHAPRVGVEPTSLVLIQRTLETVRSGDLERLSPVVRQVRPWFGPLVQTRPVTGKCQRAGPRLRRLW